MSTLEILDIVDENGTPTGETIARTEAHARGIRHRTVHIWVVRKTADGYEVLLQKRAAGKDSFPGCYDSSSSGHMQAGDEPLASALRELQEELGICAKPEDLQPVGNFSIRYQKEFYGKLFRDHEVAFVYIYARPVDTALLTLQAEEVESVAWFPVEYVHQMLDPRDPRFCVPAEGFAIAKAWCEKH